MKNRFFYFPFLIAITVIFIICSLFSGCYTLTQGITMLGYLSRAVPLEQLDDDTFVSLVMDIRSFASEYLGLAESKNYTKYVELDRSFLASVVSASAKDSFTRYEWNYPVVGRMPYKGFFDLKGAQKERDRLERKDLDVWIRSVDAFSTLGWFNDPLYSYMRNYSPDRLAELIIHEQVHATVFFRGQVQFNEELAQFIGSEGARLYMEMRYGLNSDEYRKMLVSEIDSRSYIAFLQELIEELDVLYAAGNPSHNRSGSSSVTGHSGREEILMEKEKIIYAAKVRFDAEYDERFLSDNFRGFTRLPVNNAYLDLFRLYYDEDNFYIDLYERSGSNLPAFIAAAKTLNAKSGDFRNQLENALLQ